MPQAGSPSAYLKVHLERLPAVLTSTVTTTQGTHLSHNPPTEPPCTLCSWCLLRPEQLVCESDLPESPTQHEQPLPGFSEVHLGCAGQQRNR